MEKRLLREAEGKKVKPKEENVHKSLEDFLFDSVDEPKHKIEVLMGRFCILTYI